MVKWRTWVQNKSFLTPLLGVCYALTSMALCAKIRRDTDMLEKSIVGWWMDGSIPECFVVEVVVIGKGGAGGNPCG
jgi:hypothetical protein